MWLTVMRLFGIGHGNKPYPTNDASASSEAKHIYKTFRRAANIGIFPFIRRFASIGDFTLSSFFANEIFFDSQQEFTSVVFL